VAYASDRRSARVTTTERVWKVVLIVEDDTDGRTLRRLLAATDVGVEVDWLPAGGIGEIKRRADKLVKLARDRIGTAPGCVAVVVDRDGQDATTDEPHRSIRETCTRVGVPYVEAVEAVEAWFLADPGIAAWLKTPTNRLTDGLRDPKQVVAKAFYKVTGRGYYRRRSRPQVADHATGVDPKRSTSWNAAISLLARCGVPIGGAR